MKWVTHQAGAILGALALNVSPAAAIMVIPGAILPDLADFKLAGYGKNRRQKQKIFARIHRGSTHWFGWWLGLLVLVLSIPIPNLAQDALAGIALGGFSHVFMDMLTPRGIPLFPFGPRCYFSAPICSTGTYREYIFLIFIILGSIILLWQRIEPLLG